MEAFSKMVNGDDDDDGHVFGSALNPGSLHGANEKKEIAKPMAQVEVKTNNRAVGGGAIAYKENHSPLTSSPGRRGPRQSPNPTVWYQNSRRKARRRPPAT